MSSLLINLLLLGIGGAFAPLLISISILLLSSAQPRLNACAYVLGMISSLVLVGGLALALFDGPVSVSSMALRIGPLLSIILGGLCLVLALRSYLNVPDPDAPPPQWMTSLDTITPIRAYLFGIVLVATNLKLLAIYAVGLAQILAAELGLARSFITLLLFLLVMEIGVLTPLIVYIATPDRAAPILDAGKRWLASGYRWVMIVLFLALGIYFATGGLQQLARA